MFVLRLVVATLICTGISLADSIRVGVAIRLKDAMDQVVKDYESDTGEKIELVYGSSGQIAAQISSGAPIDLFISAANKQVDDLAREGLLITESRRVVAANTLAKLLDSFALKAGTVRVDATRNLVLVQGSGADRRNAVETVLSFDGDRRRGQAVGHAPGWPEEIAVSQVSSPLTFPSPHTDEHCSSVLFGGQHWICFGSGTPFD